MKKIVFFVVTLLMTSLAAPVTVAAETAMAEVLKVQNPSLYKLYREYEPLQKTLADYANRQGFRSPFENFGVVLHEMIHLKSVSNSGFFLDGIFYEPYLNASHWPNLKNADVAIRLLPSEKSLITSVYFQTTPDNNLGNIIDEINAYSQTHIFICRNEPQSIDKQRVNLVGFLRVLEAYLRILRITSPKEYEKFVNDAQGAGAVDTFVLKAWEALASCGAPIATFRFPEAVQFIRYHQTIATRGQK